MALQTSELIKLALEKAGGYRQLGKVLGISHSAIYAWKDGRIPRTDFYMKLSEFVGIPVNSPDSDNISEPVTIYGNVAAGSSSTAFEVEKTYESFDSLWHESAYRKYTRDKVIYLKISGPSMEPDYPEGSLLACAEPAVKEIKPLTPVIAYVRGEEATFKLYNLSENTSGKKEVELIPLNRSFLPRRYKPNEVTVRYIVLGTINPWRFGLKPAHESNGLLLVDDGPKPSGPFKVEV